jgi:hypothetical protein
MHRVKTVFWVDYLPYLMSNFKVHFILPLFPPKGGSIRAIF